MKKRILLLDTSSVLHIIKHGNKNIKKKDQSTYIIFGFLLKLQLLMRKTKANICVFATDSMPEDSLRKKIYPNYKLKRNTKEKTEKELKLDAMAWPQFDLVEQDILPSMGYSNIFNTKGFEADDIIGKICKTYRNNEIVIVTSDQDMYQLLTDTVCILKPSTNTYYTKAKFIKEYGIEPKMWKRIKSMAGCTSDEVKGVSGVGEKTALKFLKNELPTHYKTYESLTSREGKDIINRNKSLVILPFRGTPNYKITEDRISKIKINNMAKKYNFPSICSDLDDWYLTLKGY